MELLNRAIRLSKNFLHKALLCASLFFPFLHTLAQAPVISYQTPQTYSVNTAITPLAPTNTGGAVPATIYGQVTTFAGTGNPGTANGQAATASFNNVYDLAIDGSANIYLAEYGNQLIRKITSTGVVSTLAGNGNTGANNGPGSSASFDRPGGVITDVMGNVYVGDQVNNLVRKITATGVVSTFAGNGNQGSTNGATAFASFDGAAGLDFDNAGNLYVAERNNNQIRKITPGGVVSTFAGNLSPGNTNGIGTLARFSGCSDIAIDQAGNLYVADRDNHLIRKITPAGVVSTFAGSGAQGKADGQGTAASFYRPFNVDVDIEGNVYVSDQFNHLIRKITPAGLVTTIAGSGTQGSVNAIGTAAGFNYPTGMALDGLGNLYIAESAGNLVRKLVLTGYTIDKALPPGLLFDQTTGIITGTPTIVWPPTNYNITAYNASGSSSKLVNIAVTALIQSVITFPAIADRTTCNIDFQANASSSNRNIAIIYTSSNTAVATVSSAGIIHITGVGTTNITASQPGDASFSAATPVTQPLTVYSPVTPFVTITSNVNTTCEGTPVTFFAFVNNTVVNPLYQWKKDGADVGTNSNTYSGVIDRINQVRCIVIDQDGCATQGVSNAINGLPLKEVKVVKVTVDRVPQTAVCTGTNITFTASVTNYGVNTTYEWLVNGVNKGPNHFKFVTNTLSNNDEIICRVTNNDGVPCLIPNWAASIPQRVSINSPATPIPSVSIAASTNNVYPGTPITFNATPQYAGPITSIQWKVNGANAGSGTPVFTTSALTNNSKVTCTITSSLPCTVPATSNEVIITIVDRPPPVIPPTPATVQIANSFTPNADGVNDKWEIPALATYPKNKVKIFNRYGELLFSSIGYSTPWDGMLGGKALPAATYYYVIDLGNQTKALSGYLTIIK